MDLDRDKDIAFSINACDRCRKRKARCDPGIPSCQGCEAAGAICAFTDARTRRTSPRSNVLDLEDQIAQLEAQIARLGNAESIGNGPRVSNSSSIVADGDARDEGHHPDLIHVEAGGDGHFLGASSGMQLARSVLESARRNSTAFDGQDPSAQSGDSHDATALEDQTTDAEVNVTEIKLPSWETVTRLVETYFQQYEVQYPILDKDEFMKDASDLYFGSDPLERSLENPRIIFMLNMVLSIALMSSDDSGSVKLAERFRRNASTQLSSVMQTKDHQTLQCLLLLLLSSTLSSKSAPLWYISGICMRMCVDLGYHSEDTIRYTTNDGRSDGKQDTKRRLFWVTYTFDRSLAKMLGRPFFVEEGKLQVDFPEASLPEHVRLPLRCWLDMQRMQSEIVSNIYSSEQRRTQNSEATTRSLRWKSGMRETLVEWLATTKRLPTQGTYTAEWWEYWYQHARLMLNQPTPSASQESLAEAFDAAEAMVRLSFIRAHRSVAKFTWLDVHLQLVSGLTLLFLVLKSPHTRSKARSNWIGFKGCIIEWQVVLGKLAKRWTAMVKMKSVLGKLADGVLDSIENDKLPEGGGTRRRAAKVHRQQTRLAIQELKSPSDVAFGRSPVSVNQGGPTTRKRRRAHDSEGQSQEQMDYTPPSAASQSQEEQLQAYPYETLQGYGAPFDNMEFPSILGGDMFTDIDQLGAPLQLDLGLFDLQQTDMMAAAGSDPFAFQWMGSRLDTTLTDSVLNFHGNLDGDQTQSGDNNGYTAQYE